MRIMLTEELIRDGLLCPPGRSRWELVDLSEAVGLYIELRATREGYGVYRYRYRSPATNKTRHARIGGTDEVTLEEARRKAKAMRSQVIQGIDPQDAATAAPEDENRVPRLEDFFEKQYISYAKTRKRGWHKEKQIFAYRLEEKFGDQRLDEISLPEVQAYHTSLLEDGQIAPATANHVVKLLRHILNVAVRWEIISKNPVARVTLARENNKVERYLDDGELGRLIKVLQADNLRSRNAADVALLLLASRARSDRSH